MRRVQLRRALLHATLLVAAASTAVFACGDPYSESSEPPPLEEAGTPDTTPAPDTAAPPDPCVHALPPGPPLVDDAPAEELPAFFMAVRTVGLSTGDPSRGFDLDGVCTCEKRPNTARDGGDSCNAKQARCDQDGGVDNAVAVLAAQLSPFFALDSVPNRLINSGRRTLLVQIGKYNGRANDKEIAVGLALSDGVREQGCPTSVEDPARGIWSPGWCANDRWSFVPDAVLPGTDLPLIQGVGYVTNGVITLQVPSLVVPFNDISVLNVGSAVITGDLVPLGEDLTPRDRSKSPTEKEKRLWSITGGLIAGRLKAVDLLVALGTIDRAPDGGARVYLCEEKQYSFARATICDGTDIAATKTLDFDPGAKCESLSIGASYTAFPALPGDVRSLTPEYNPCTPGPNGQPPEAGTADPPYRCP